MGEEMSAEEEGGGRKCGIVERRWEGEAMVGA